MGELYLPVFLRRVFLFCTILAQAVSAVAGVTLTGSVADSSGLPIAGAHVTVTERQITTVSAFDGGFLIPDLPPARYTVQATHIGFSKQSISIDPRDGAHLYIPIVLTPLPVSLQAVDIAVPNSNSRAINALGTVRISRAQWESAGCHSLPDALRLIPGLIVKQGDHRLELSVNGAPSRMTTITLDGVPLSDIGTGTADLGALNLSQISVIALHLKPMGGEVQLRTTTETNITDSLNSYRFDGGYRINGAKDISLNLSTPQSRFHLTGSGGFSDDSGVFAYQLDDGSFHSRVNNDMRGEYISGSVQYLFTGGQWDGGLFLEQSDRGIPGLIYSTPTPSARLGNNRYSVRTSGEFRIKQVRLNTDGYYSRYQSRFTSPAKQVDPTDGTVYTLLPEDNEQTGYRAGGSVSAEGHLWIADWTVKGSHIWDHYEGQDLLRQTSTISGVGKGLAKRYISTGSASARYKGEKLLRYDISLGWSSDWINDQASYRLDSPTANLRAELPLAWGNIALTSGWGRSTSPPAFNALFLVENSYSAGNPNIKPEKGETARVGLSASHRSAWGSLILSSDFFHQSIADMIVWKRNWQGKYYPDNIAQTVTDGVNCEARWLSGNSAYRLTARYNYNDSRNDSPANVNYGKRVPLTALHTGSLQTVVQWASYSWSTQATYTGKRYSTESNMDPLSEAGMGLSPYLLVDCTISRKWLLQGNGLTLTLSINNLLDSSYRIIERSPMPGREYGIHVTFQGTLVSVSH